ncbi:hypothetical protein SeMB42_g02504 [Synchytrium endobioticum]|uniref:TAFII55 protein conserved region domain-containing protein n=1 Tax=Synchytrium endobioticum TaxID=286115 RepID=A0A507DDD4_9FUNG|nr:hypothetical protein SeLEV6574_g02274 [Synchytrium endobioticum]TPX49709.1 hypothetical protein SeMB42_g02504 [Synchytrium endobioticum]
MTSLTALILRSKGGSTGGGSQNALSSQAPPKLPTLRLQATGQVKQKNKNKSKRPEPKPLEDGLADDFIEDHLILRLPQEQANRLRTTLKKGEATSDLSFYFTDSRRAVATIGKDKFRAKIVDLPCIIEAHKTYDNRQFYKISDISQMLLVEGPAPPNMDDTSILKPYEKTKDWRWEHGITPPMKWVRKRRFRPRMPTSAIEEVEREVLRLLEEDLLSEEIEIELRYLTEEDGIEPEEEESDPDEEMMDDQYDHPQHEYNLYNDMMPYDPNDPPPPPQQQQQQYAGYDYSTMPIQNLSIIQPQVLLQQPPPQQFLPPSTSNTPHKTRQAESDEEDEEEDYEEEGDEVFDQAFDEAFQGDGDEDEGDIFNPVSNVLPKTMMNSDAGDSGEEISMDNGDKDNLDEYEEVEIQFDDLGESGNEEEDEFEEVVIGGAGQDDAEDRNQLRRDLSTIQARIEHRDQEIAKTTNPILLKRMVDERKSMMDELMEKRNALQQM